MTDVKFLKKVFISKQECKGNAQLYLIVFYAMV